MNEERTTMPVSVLDLVPVREGHTTKEALQDMVKLAKHVEELGYQRFWLSEHHNTPTLASSATSILIAKVLDNTESIEVGSGGIMLPNHTPLVVAEQFGTLETMYPGRVNLGLGRAPGTDMRTAHALRRTNQETAFVFPQDVVELQTYLKSAQHQGTVHAHPGVGTEVPIFILGSSTSSAQLAARLGLPYVFAAHFAPQQLEQALHIYRSEFEPSEYLSKPYVMVCVNVIAAETNEEAETLSTSSDLFYLNVVRGTQNLLQPPVRSMDGRWNFYEESMVHGMSKYTFKGDRNTVSEQINRFCGELEIDELMAVSYIYDQEKRKRSYEILKDAIEQ
ncbi:LLM class flavin-dependent oxidoreductase [Planomicrobium sp. CPCC 101110]|uniref:LLM class flavin-dependent oxidoreductase n=1 Tax=Planomicrobium sp. CPCC 101110 TaxID=2599619 RepID=UPI0011B74690|nr:LLM class flavin-dependent oxidoreductase [Planomicrobium sp. CPCC 101110]TWT24786.1 LLM class flavin-dependent oxidoreductase [Planomicrobium sp. CPCC 101110]